MELLQNYSRPKIKFFEKNLKKVKDYFFSAMSHTMRFQIGMQVDLFYMLKKQYGSAESYKSGKNFSETLYPSSKSVYIFTHFNIIPEITMEVRFLFYSTSKNL